MRVKVEGNVLKFLKKQGSGEVLVFSANVDLVKKAIGEVTLEPKTTKKPKKDNPEVTKTLNSI